MRRSKGLLSACWLILGCGGNAVIDDGDRARGGCAGACDAIAGCSAQDGCVDGCVDVPPGCEGVRDDFMDCYAAGTDSVACSMPPSCSAQLDAYLACQSTLIEGESGSYAGSSCSFSAEDDAGTLYEAKCSEALCLCVINSVEVGTCTAAAPPPGACAIKTGCCAGLLFIPVEPHQGHLAATQACVHCALPLQPRLHF